MKGNFMQVNNVSNNSASFGMALKIKPGAKSALKETSLDFIQKLQKSGTELKDTRYYDLEIIEGGTPRIAATHFANAYVPPFDFKKPSDQFLHVATKWDGNVFSDLTKGSNYDLVIKFANNAVAKDVYKSLAKKTDFDKALELTKILERRAIEKNNELINAENYKKQVADAVDKLFGQFGQDA